MENKRTITYRFGNFQVEDIDVTDLETLLDIVMDLYLDVLGVDEQEIVEYFEREGFTVVQVED